MTKFDENKIECMSSGTEGTMKASIRIEDVKEYAITENETLEQMYSLRYVQLMCQFNKLATVMEMGFNDESPMIMKYRLDVPAATEQNVDKEEEDKATDDDEEDEEDISGDRDRERKIEKETEKDI